jgi:hypothetical protein
MEQFIAQVVRHKSTSTPNLVILPGIASLLTAAFGRLNMYFVEVENARTALPHYCAGVYGPRCLLPTSFLYCLPLHSQGNKSQGSSLAL